MAARTPRVIEKAGYTREFNSTTAAMFNPLNKHNALWWAKCSINVQYSTVEGFHQMHKLQSVRAVDLFPFVCALELDSHTATVAPSPSPPRVCRHHTVASPSSTPRHPHYRFAVFVVFFLHTSSVVSVACANRMLSRCLLPVVATFLPSPSRPRRCSTATADVIFAHSKQIERDEARNADTQKGSPVTKPTIAGDSQQVSLHARRK
ncbi:unnamed protein product [Cuscuta campestris]|uniref:Uncharacterized protein n=1 Tax=Cuscuta campestris TaxID=132261 RepID=A0A484LGU7_9ASTE|nr:unnamed protein product [Cuscuta campestris]